MANQSEMKIRMACVETKWGLMKYDHLHFAISVPANPVLQSDRAIMKETKSEMYLFLRLNHE